MPLELDPSIPNESPNTIKSEPTQKESTVPSIYDEPATDVLVMPTWIGKGLKGTGRILRRSIPVILLARTIISALLQAPPISKGLVSLCEIPAISSTCLCAGKLESAEEVQWADFPAMVWVQNAIVETFVGENPGGSEMALQIVKAELATRDLITAVRYSNLRTAERLAEALVEFVSDATEAGDSLQELDAKALGAIDR